jgi:uncharacterized membrane protein YhaH (DUF805 family)
LKLSWYLEVLKKYAVFDGRSRRSEYWYFALFNFIITVVFEILTQASGVFLVLLYIYDLAVLLPAIGVSIRRLHDTNRSGWWILIGLIPIVGWIILIVFMGQDSDLGDNKYGSNPKLTPAAAKAG